MAQKHRIARLRPLDFPTENASVYGYMRFSYRGQSDARLSRLVTGQQQFDLLYDKDRMEQRFYVFENITLPSLKAQTCKDFRMHILMSEDMPEDYKRRMFQLVSDVQQIELIFSDAPTANDVFWKLTKENVSNTDKRTVHFRMDDDDALSARSIDEMRNTIDYAPDDALVTTPRGLLLLNMDSEVHLLRKFEPQIAIGWALVNKPGQARNPYQFRHRHYCERVPSITLPTFAAYIHSAYESCDTQPAQQKKLENAAGHDKDYLAERGIEDIKKAIAENFPWTTYDGLISVFKNMPKGKKTAVWLEDDPAPTVRVVDPVAGRDMPIKKAGT